MEDAKDLTQEFFMLVLERNLLRQVKASRGRFRSYLLQSLRNFLNDADDRKRTSKVGGRAEFVDWDEFSDETRLSVPAEMLETWSPERLFDLGWAATVAERALRRLGDECASHGRRRVFELLSVFLVAERGETSFEGIATELQVPETSVKRLLHRLRRRYGSLLREEVGKTVERPIDVDDEIRYLCGALAKGAFDL